MTLKTLESFSAAPREDLGLHIIRHDAWVPERIAALIRHFNPKSQLGLFIRECLAYLPVEMAAELIDRVSSVVVLESSLAVVHLDWSSGLLRTRDHGIVSRKVITDVGVGYLVDAWQNIVELEAMKYHGFGTGVTAEAASQTALVTECTTALNPDSTRATGSLAESSAPVFVTVGTSTFDASAAVTEHGVFSQAATGGGVMFDRSLFSAVNVVSGDSIAATYSLTASAGG